MSQALRLRLLGGPVFAAGGEEIATSASRAVPIFAVLACASERVPRERIAELLWRRVEASSALASLRQFLHHLPEALRDTIASERTTLALLRDRVDCDVWRLREALDRTAPSAAVLPLYPGPLLGDTRFDDFPEFDDWLREERAKLAAEVRRSVERDLAGIESEAALELAERWLRLHPVDEEIHARAMELHLAAGRTNAAQAQYELLRERLAVATGRAPQPATRALLEAALRKRRAPRGTLPAIATSFVGRQVELAELTRMALDPHCRLITLHGPGGVGKTRLAMAFAEEIAGQQESVWLVSLEAAESAQALYAAIAAALELQLPPRQEARAALLRLLRPKRGVLALDNYEQLLPSATKGATESATFVAELLREAPHLKVVVTSRVALGLQEEWLFQVAGLPYPDASSTNGAHDAGFELFVSRARQAYRGFSAAAERPHILAICRASEGLPLALEIAAAQVGVRPCAEIAHDLLAEPAARALNRPERQSSVLHVIERSLAAASGDQAASFTKLALFQGTFSAEQAFAVARVAEGDLNELVARALLARAGHGFRMHPLLRQVASKRLQKNRALARRIEAAFVKDTARREWIDLERLFGAGSPQARARIAEHIDDGVQALRLAAAHGDEESAWALATALFHEYLAKGSVRAGLAAWPDADAPGLSQRMRAILRIRGADLLRHTAAFDAVVGKLKIARVEAGHDPRLVYAIEASLAGIEIFRGGYARCVEHCEAALALEDEARTEFDHVRLGSILGTALAELGEFDRAREVLEDSLARAEALGGAAALMVHPLNALGGLAEYTGKSEECADIHRRAIAMLEAEGLYSLLAPHWCNLGGALHGLERHAEALPAFEKGIEISVQLGDLGPQTYSQIGAANALVGLRRFADAARMSLEAQENARRMGSSSLLSEAVVVGARAALEAGDAESARAMLLRYETDLVQRDSGFRRVEEVSTLVQVVHALGLAQPEVVARACASLAAFPGALERQRSNVLAWAREKGLPEAAPVELEEAARALVAAMAGSGSGTPAKRGNPR